MNIISLTGKSLCELEEILSPLEQLRIKQIYKWLTRGVSDFSQMTDIPACIRGDLKTRFKTFSGKAVSCHDDRYAKKIIVALNDGEKTECVLLNDGKNRLTSCLSVQAGCPIGCVFCKTGSLGFKRNLDAHEIAEQFFFLQNSLPGKAEKKDEKLIDNIVIMGMGEPLLNLEQLRKTISFFMDTRGMNYSRRRITASTCGICGGLFDLANNGPYIKLAFSLVTADEKLRRDLIPAAKSNPLKKIKEALVLFQDKGGGRITLEIPLLGGVNTRDKDTQLLAQFAAGLDNVINVIPWNPVQGFMFEGKPLNEPEKKETFNFINKLENKGLKVTMRLRKGRSVMGACGQLGE